MNGEVTEAPLAGVLTLTPVAGLAGVSPETVMATSVTHESPLSPHDFTCRVCLPDVAVTWALMEVLFTTVVSVLLSSEKPMESTGCEEQVAEFATSSKGDVTEAPLPGLLTVTPASAGVASITSNDEGRKSFFFKRFTQHLHA